MVYGAGQAINGASALSLQIREQLSQLSQVATNRYVAAIAQLDSSTPPSVRYVLDPLGRQQPIALLDINAGNPDELVDFVSWAANVCPAARSILVLSGHGAAWEDSLARQILATRTLATRAVNMTNAMPPVPLAIHHARRLFGPDISNVAAATRAVLLDGGNRDYLANAELASACARIAQAILRDRLDVLVFDACLMSAWEILHELRGSVRVIVASIDELSAAGIGLAAPVSRISSGSGQHSATEIGRILSEEFEPRTSFDSCVSINIEAPEWDAGVRYFHEFCQLFLSWIEEARANADAALAALQSASRSVVKFTGGGLADVGSLARAIAEIPGVPREVVACIESAVKSVSTCVLARSTGTDYRAAVGVSVLSPPNGATYASNRFDYTQLRLPIETGWWKVLDSLFGVESAHHQP